jgi:hypothetical protein
MPRSLTPEQQDEVVKLLRQTEEPDVADRLTDWEKEFIQSAAEQYANISWLSPEKQIPKLKQIVEGTGKRPNEDREERDRHPINRRYEGFSGFGRKRGD